MSPLGFVDTKRGADAQVLTLDVLTESDKHHYILAVDHGPPELLSTYTGGLAAASKEPRLVLGAARLLA